MFIDGELSRPMLADEPADDGYNIIYYMIKLAFLFEFFYVSLEVGLLFISMSLLTITTCLEDLHLMKLTCAAKAWLGSI
jgi:hypothetical protein